MAFKVMCINENWVDDGTPVEPAPAFKEVCTVTKSYCTKQMFHAGYTYPAGIYYVLEGYPKFAYHSSNFSVLPDDDADQMKENVREAIINIEQPITN